MIGFLAIVGILYTVNTRNYVFSGARPTSTLSIGFIPKMRYLTYWVDDLRWRRWQSADKARHHNYKRGWR